MRTFFIILCTVATTLLSSQTIINLSADTTITSTWEFSENTIIQPASGVMVKLMRGPGDFGPIFRAVDGATVLIKNLWIAKVDRKGFASVIGDNSEVQWLLKNMEGAIAWDDDISPVFLDGTPKPVIGGQ